MPAACEGRQSKLMNRGKKLEGLKLFERKQRN